jgi:aminoglycoside phosphotransferase (APT) family kinase protein
MNIAPSPLVGLPADQLARLVAWCDKHLPGSDGPLEVSRISATGTSNEMFAIRRGGDRWALRKPPRVKNAPSAHDVQREYRLLTALEGTAVPHPRPVAACDDPAVLGGPFYVMEHVDGFSPELPLGPPFDDPAVRHGLGIELVDGIAALARIDWRRAGLDGFGKPDGYLERQVDRWLGQLERYRTREIPGLDEVAAWLTVERPVMGAPAILHGDYSFFNVMFARDLPARLVAIVDWETATIGDPLVDLGWVLAQWSEAGEEPILHTNITHLPGMATRRELAARYAAQSGRPIADIRFYMVLAVFKLVCIIEGSYHRYVNGQSDNPQHALFETLVPTLALHASSIARGEWAPEL